MEFLKISEKHLKISLSKEEIDSYMTKDGGEETLALDAILASVGAHTGMDFSKEVYVKYYPAPDGSGELFVTLGKEERALVFKNKKGVFCSSSPSDMEKLLFLMEKRNLSAFGIYKNNGIRYLLLENLDFESELLLSEFANSVQGLSPLYMTEHFQKER